MDVKGPFPKRMLKKGAFTNKHFESDPGMSFKLYEDDPVTRQPVCFTCAKLPGRIKECPSRSKHA